MNSKRNISEIKKTNQNDNFDLFFKTKIHKNCRDFYKRIYDLDVEINEQFVNSLAVFGKLHINRFSQIIPTSLDIFSVKGANNLEITGGIGGDSIFLVIPKNKTEQFVEFEELLKKYVIANMDR